MQPSRWFLGAGFLLSVLGGCIGRSGTPPGGTGGNTGGAATLGSGGTSSGTGGVIGGLDASGETSGSGGKTIAAGTGGGGVGGGETGSGGTSPSDGGTQEVTATGSATDGGGGVEAGVTDGNRGDGDGSAGVPAMGPIIGTPLATFDVNVNGFTLNRFAEVGNLALLPTPATLSWISTDGSPNPGCLKITAPYSGPKQWVDIEPAAFTAPLPNWSGRKLHVRIKLDPSSTFAGFVRLYVKTGAAFVFYTSAFTPYPQNSGWQEFVLPLVSPAPVPPANPGADATQIVNFGVDPITADVTPTMPTPVTFYVDSFSIE